VATLSRRKVSSSSSPSVGTPATGCIGWIQKGGQAREVRANSPLITAFGSGLRAMVKACPFTSNRNSGSPSTSATVWAAAGSAKPAQLNRHASAWRAPNSIWNTPGTKPPDLR